MLNYYEIASKNLENLSELEFLSDKNESLKKTIIKYLSEVNNQMEQTKVNNDFKKLVDEIKENSIYK